jgi:hypothetical protein
MVKSPWLCWGALRSSRSFCGWPISREAKGKPRVYFRFSKDLNTTSFIADSTPDKQIQQGIGKLQGVFGWSKLLISLVRKFKSLKELYLDFKSLTTT